MPSINPHTVPDHPSPPPRKYPSTPPPTPPGHRTAVGAFGRVGAAVFGEFRGFEVTWWRAELHMHVQGGKTVSAGKGGAHPIG